MKLELNRRSVLLLSLVEFVVVAGVTIYLVNIWYPGFYSNLFGAGYKLFGLLAMLILLGPVLGISFYKSDHEAYANDLSVLYVVKLCVVFLALHLAYSQRPFLVVFSVDRFVLIQANQIALEQVPPDILRMAMFSESPPVIAARKLPEDDLGLLLEVMSGEADIEYRPAQYERFKYQRERFSQRLCRPDSVDGDEKSDYDRGCELVTVPLVYKGDRYATAVFDSKDSKIKNIVLNDPW